MASLTAFLFRRRGSRLAAAVLTAFVALTTLPPAVHGQTAAAPVQANTESTRPRIGLVLSGSDFGANFTLFDRTNDTPVKYREGMVRFENSR